MRAIALLCLLLAALPAAAQRLPDLKHQDAWSDSDKKAFLDYVESGKTAPIKGSVKQTENQEAVEALGGAAAHRARYATLSLTGGTLLTNGAGKLTRQSTNFGGRLLLGQHLF